MCISTGNGTDCPRNGLLLGVFAVGQSMQRTRLARLTGNESVTQNHHTHIKVPVRQSYKLTPRKIQTSTPLSIYDAPMTASSM
jgi:hypothetical protein